MITALIFNNRMTHWGLNLGNWEVDFMVNQHRKKKKNRTRLFTYALVVR